MKAIQVNGQCFWVNLNFSLDEICKEIFGYLGLEGWRSWSGGRENLTAAQVRQRRVITLAVRKQIANYKREKNRNPAPEKSRKSAPDVPQK